MLEGKVFEALNMVFPSVGSFVDRATGLERGNLMTQAHKMFSELESGMIRNNIEKILGD